MNAERPAQDGFERLLRAMALLAGLILLVLTVFTVLDVVLRYFFNSPMRGSLEFTEYAMALIVFLSLAWCGATGGHIAVDLLDRWLDTPRFFWLPALVALIGALLFAVIAWRMTVETVLGWNQIGNMLRWPHWPFKLVAAFGALMFSLATFVQCLRAWRARALSGQR